MVTAADAARKAKTPNVVSGLFISASDVWVQEITDHYIVVCVSFQKKIRYLLNELMLF